MTKKCELITAAESLESQLGKLNDAPIRHRRFLEPGVREAFSMLAAAEPGFAFEWWMADRRLTALCMRFVPEVVARLGGTPHAVAAIGRVRSQLSAPERVLLEIAEAASEETTLRQAALDEVLTYASGIRDELRIARLCCFYLWQVRAMSPHHARKLVEVAANSVARIEIVDYRDYYAVRDFVSCLDQGDLAPDILEAITGKLRACEQYWEIEGDLRLLRLKIEQANEMLACVPKSDDEYLELLEQLKQEPLPVWNEQTGQCMDVPAYDGARVCVAIGGWRDFLNQFGEPIYAIMDLLFELDLDANVIPWSRCKFALLKNFHEYVGNIANANSHIEHCLFDNGLAELDGRSWDGELSGLEGSRQQIWIGEELVIPIIKEMWQAFLFVAGAVLPVLQARVEKMSAMQELVRGAPPQSSIHSDKRKENLPE